MRPYMRSPKRFHIQRSQTLRIGCFEAPHFRSDPVVSLFPCISNVGRRFEARWSATLHDCCSERVAYLSTTVHHLVADTNSAIAPADSLKRVTLWSDLLQKTGCSFASTQPPAAGRTSPGWLRPYSLSVCSGPKNRADS